MFVAMQTRVSVVMATVNGAAFIREQLESISGVHLTDRIARHLSVAGRLESTRAV